MEKAKEAVRDFTSKAGHHHTTAHEQAAPPAKHETVKPTQHEEINPAVNKEVNQDHYRRVVQPVQDREVRPEQHTHKADKVHHQEFDHRDKKGTAEVLEAEAGNVRDQRVETDTTHTQSQAPAVEGQQVHHRVHETVQPVIEKETIQPHVVHTTVPIHEVHHNPAQVHGTTTNPPVTMEQFQKHGGALGNKGQSERTKSYEGCPKGERRRSPS